MERLAGAHPEQDASKQEPSCPCHGALSTSAQLETLDPVEGGLGKAA